MKQRILSTLIFIFVALCSLFPLPKLVARAEPTTGSYACILQADVFLYATPDESKGLFLLPKSYYVKLLDYGTEYSRVEYLADEGISRRVVGFVKTPLLAFVDYTPNRPYFFYQFELRYRVEEDEPADSSFLTQITVTCVYYGEYNVGSKTYCYVLRSGEFGYVPKPNDLTVPENTEYAEYIASLEAPPEEEPTEKSPSSPAQIAILVALCLLVPVLAALILKPPKKPPYETE